MIQIILDLFQFYLPWPEILKRLYNYFMEVHGQTLEWFKSYLSNRFQAVFINGVLSEHNQIKCGVLQGSTLGPLLFLTYINDLSSIIDFATTSYRMYADNTNLTFTTCSIPEL